MTISLTDISWVAVAVATVAYFLLGGLWFSPFIFGQHYDNAIGFDRPKEWNGQVFISLDHFWVAWLLLSQSQFLQRH